MRVTQNTDIAWQEYDGEAVLVDPQDATCRVLNETASLVWRVCATPTTVAEIVAALQDEYEIDAEQARADVEEIVREFLDKRILKEA